MAVRRISDGSPQQHGYYFHMHLVVGRSYLGGMVVAMAAVASACHFDPSGFTSPDEADAEVAENDGAPIERPDAEVPRGGDDASLPQPPTAQVWMSTADGTQKLVHHPDVPLVAPSDDPALPGIAVDEEATFQTMAGFGAAMTESSAWLLATKLSSDARHALLEQLFDPENGIGLSILRLPIGASDFSLSNFSYDDSGPPLDDFSLAHDQSWTMPMLKEIQQVNPALALVATPWSPPWWMKTTNSMVGGALRPTRRALHAAYLLRFVKAYQEQGLPITALSLQNEPYNLPQSAPGMYMAPEEQAELIKTYVGPLFAANGLATQLLVWDHNWEDVDYPKTVLADDAARAFVAGTAFHCYYGDPAVQDDLHAQHPDLDIWVTECSSGMWLGDDAGNFAAQAKLLIDATRHWARAVLRWNLALDENRGPQNHGCNACTGTVEIRQGDGQVTLSPEYYTLGHFARFVRAGARRVGSQSVGAPSTVEHVAFVNPDGSLVVIVHNPDATQVAAEVRSARGAFSYSLPPGGLATFVVSAR
jgi:glucosylceramidase